MKRIPQLPLGSYRFSISWQQEQTRLETRPEWSSNKSETKLLRLPSVKPPAFVKPRLPTVGLSRNFLPNSPRKIRSGFCSGLSARPDHLYPILPPPYRSGRQLPRRPNRFAPFALPSRPCFALPLSPAQQKKPPPFFLPPQ